MTPFVKDRRLLYSFSASRPDWSFDNHLYRYYIWWVILLNFIHFKYYIIKDRVNEQMYGVFWGLINDHHWKPFNQFVDRCLLTIVLISRLWTNNETFKLANLQIIIKHCNMTSGHARSRQFRQRGGGSCPRGIYICKGV